MRQPIRTATVLLFLCSVFLTIYNADAQRFTLGRDNQVKVSSFVDAVRYLKKALSNQGTCEGRFVVDRGPDVLFGLHGHRQHSSEGFMYLAIGPRFGWRSTADFIGKCQSVISCKGGQFLLSNSGDLSASISDLDNIFAEGRRSCHLAGDKTGVLCDNTHSPNIFYSASSNGRGKCEAKLVATYEGEKVLSIKVILGGA